MRYAWIVVVVLQVAILAMLRESMRSSTQDMRVINEQGLTILTMQSRMNHYAAGHKHFVLGCPECAEIMQQRGTSRGRWVKDLIEGAPHE